MNEFVNYGNEWQLYKGEVDWEDLTISQQDEIIVSYMQPEGSDIYPADVVMKQNTKKRQVDRIGDLFACVSFRLETKKIISSSNAWTPGHKKIMCDFYTGTLFGRRLKEVVEGSEGTERTRIPASDFDGLENELHVVLCDLSLTQLQEFVWKNLAQDPEVFEANEEWDKIVADAFKAAEENHHAVSKKIAEKPKDKIRKKKFNYRKFEDKFIAPLVVLVIVGVFLFFLSEAIWSHGKRVLGYWGIIDYQYETAGDRRYKTFLNTVNGCQLKDAVSSPEKTDKWPRYAVYACPDGSRKTWRYKVKVITDFKGKLIVE